MLIFAIRDKLLGGQAMSATSVFDDIQYREGVITYREQYRLLVQILHLFFLADITVLGFAVQSQSIAMAALTMVFPFAMFIVRNAIRGRMIPIIYECVRHELRTGTNFGLMSKYHLLAEEKSLVEIAKSNVDRSDDETAKRAYRKIKGNVVANFVKSIFLGRLGLYVLFHVAVLIAFLFSGSISFPLHLPVLEQVP